MTPLSAKVPFFSSRRDWLWGLFLAIATLLAYQPAWNGKPIWDDAAHLTYPQLRSWAGLVHIWAEPGATQQYYPVVHSVFWLEHKLWGDSTLGYHLVNILLHITAALLLLKALRTLEIPAAGIAAAIFALHPLQVESVAWISELKNTLSAVCYFGAALAFLRFDRSRGKEAYAGALALFMVGLMAKTVIATLPAALLVVFWWQRGKLSWKQDVLPLIPFFAAGIAAGLFTSWMERWNGAHGAEFNFSFVGRCLIAGRAIWFYLGKLFWPADLMFFYPRWKINPSIGWQYLFPAAAALLAGALWALRRWARWPLAALLFFVGTLFPALGFFNVFPFKYSFVADHFQYLAGVGPIALASAGIHRLFHSFRDRSAFLETTFCAFLLAGLCVLTWRESRMYTNIETLWQTTLKRNPDCWVAQNDLGAILLEKGQVNRAIVRFRSALAIQPDDDNAQNNLGVALEKKGLLQQAISRFRAALALRPGFAEACCNLADILLQQGQVDAAIFELQKGLATRPDFARLYYTLGNALLQKGDIDNAIVQFQKAIALRPDDDHAHYNLGVALRRKGDANDAILEFQKAVALRPNFAEGQNNLGNSLLMEGRVDEAIVHLRKALDIEPEYLQAHYNLGNALLREGQAGGAVLQFQKLLARQPNSAEIHTKLGDALLQDGRVDDAIFHFQKALIIQADFAEAQKNLALIAWRLATSAGVSPRDGTKAVQLARQLDQLNRNSNPTTDAILAAAYAEAGEFPRAIEAAERALELATRRNDPVMVGAIQMQLNSYKAGAPFRGSGSPP